MRIRYWATLLLMAVAPARAEAVKIDLHGIALGMTADQVKSGAGLPCTSLAYSSDVACKDDSDGADYHASFSAGTPSVVLTVARSFCSHDAPATIRDGVLAEFHKPRGSDQPDPNGFHVDLDDKTEAILNADDGTCPDGRGKHYVLSLRGNGLIKAGSDQAIDRAKKALH